MFANEELRCKHSPKQNQYLFYLSLPFNSYYKQNAGLSRIICDGINVRCQLIVVGLIY